MYGRLRYWTILAFVVEIVRCGFLFTSPTKKTWAYDVNYGNPNNWEGGKIPCANSRAVLPSFTSVFIQVNTSIREMVFADEGELILGSNINLALGEQVKSSLNVDCPRQDVKFKDPEYNGWYLADAWRIDGVEQNETMIPFPDIERIPCYYDEVNFKRDSSFAVKIEGPPVSVRSLSVADQSLNTSEFERLVTTVSGQHQFHKLTTVTMHNTSCSGKNGCLCGNNKQSIVSVVCKLKKCPDVDCKDPIKSRGSCCSLCGSMVVVEYNTDFEFSKLFNIYQRLMIKSGYDNVYGYVSKIEEGTIQATFLDKTASHKAAALAHEIETYVQEDMKNLGTLGISGISVRVSTNWIQHSLTQNQGLSVGGVMGIVIAFILMVAIALAVFGYYRKRRWVNLSFGRLYDEAKHEEQPITFSAASATLRGFANPMYQEPATGPLYEDTAIGPQVRTSTEERSNPMFTGTDECEDGQSFHE